MSTYNKVTLMGRLTRDPDMKYTPKGTAVCRLGLAVNRRWRDDNGTEKEEVTFVDVDSFGKRAETLGKYFKKGEPILIEGRLKMDAWNDKNTGEKRTKLSVMCEQFSFIPRPGQSSTPPETPAPSSPTPDDDVPF